VQTAPTQVLGVEQEGHGHVALEGGRGEVALDSGQFSCKNLLDLLEVELDGVFGGAVGSVLHQIFLQNLHKFAFLRLFVLGDIVDNLS
jgi:hypothetical protein